MQTANRTINKGKILLVGDVICDVHHYGNGRGFSIEAPVPVALHEHTTINWGGAGLVARNLLALGKPVFFISVIGGDAYGKGLLAWQGKNLNKKFFVDEDRRTITKERFIVGGKKVLRWNRGDSRPISKRLEEKIFMAVSRALSRSRLILIADYRHGLLTRRLARRILKLAHEAGKEVWVDSQVAQAKANHRWYRGADFICVNEKEAKSLDKRFDEKDLPNSLRRLRRTLDAENVTIKLGARGSASLLGKEYVLIPAPKVKEVDTVGAGDAFIAALASREKLSKDSLSYASRWAALAVTIPGTEPPRRSMLKTI